jgi:type IV pilus modification protein PilV
MLYLKRQKNILGFSLLEVLIAIIVLGVGLLGIAKIQGTTMLNSAESRMQTHAVNLAQEKIAEFRHYANKSVYSAYASDSVGTDVVGENATFTRTWSISACPDSVICKQISVKVAWVAIDGTNPDVELTSKIAEIEPAKSGMVVASVAMVADTSAESAAQAAAHAAAAASYEAQVAASSDATDAQKADAAAAKDVAEQAASDAQDAADIGDATEAAAQAEIAAAAAAEILAILQSLPGPSYSFTGTVDDSATEVTVEDGSCTIPSTGSYSCSVATFASDVSVTATDGTLTVSCSVDVTAEPVVGCPLTLSANCTSPWGGADITDGAFVTAFESSTSATCPNEERLCTAGSLSGSYTNESCMLLCTVPQYVTGGKVNASSGPTQWNTTGPGAITYGYSGNKTVASQSLPAGSEQDCTLTLHLND